MDIEKINDFVNVYSDVLQLNDELRQNIKELIQNLVKKYSGLEKSVDIRQYDLSTHIIDPTNPNYSLEDFFLNRLMNNIVSFNQNNSMNSKGHYQPQFLKVELNDEKIERQVTLEGYPEEELQVIKENARKKVIRHEIEHGLQATFPESSLSYYSQSYHKKMIERLSRVRDGKYIGQIRQTRTKTHNDRDIITKGFGTSYKTDEMLIETFNETESIDMTGSRMVQRTQRYDSGNSFPVFNDESSNWSITNYGYMLKILLGKSETFEGMYFNPEKIMDIFNQRYGDIIKDAYKEMYKNQYGAVHITDSPIDIIQKVMANIRKTNSESEHLKLNEVFARCLQRKIEVTKEFESEDEIKQQIEGFKEFIISNDDKEKNATLKHNQIIAQIESSLLISRECSNPDKLKEFWINGVKGNYDEYIEESYWERGLALIAEWQIGDKEVNSTISTISDNMKKKYNVVSDLTKNKGRVEDGLHFHNLDVKGITIDQLAMFCIQNEDMDFNTLNSLNACIQKFGDTIQSDEDREKMDFIKEKFNFICEEKKKLAIQTLKRIYKDKVHRIQQQKGKLIAIDELKDFLPDSMIEGIQGEQIIAEQDIRIYDEMDNIFVLAETEMSEDLTRKKEKIQQRASRVMQMVSPKEKNDTEEEWGIDDEWTDEHESIAFITDAVNYTESVTRTGKINIETQKIKQRQLERQEPETQQILE